mgnify:CR=1 FL=1
MLMKVMVAALTLAVCITAAAAAPTLNNASGYVQLPDAAVAEKGQYILSAAYVESEGDNELSVLGPALPCTGEGYNLRVLTGLGENSELGVGFLNIDKDSGDASAVTVAAKYVIFTKPESKMALAVGASYRDWSADIEMEQALDILEVELPQVTSIYLVLDKEWDAAPEQEWVFTTSLGVSWDHYSDSNQEWDSGAPFIVPDDVPIDSPGEVEGDSFISPFLAVKAVNGDWTLMGEYKPRLDEDGFNYASEIWSLAVAKQCKSNWAVTAGITNFNMPYTDSDADWFVDISYAFGR